MKKKVFRELQEAVKEMRELRDNEKPSAPANLVMPKPVAVPVAPAKVSQSAKQSAR